MIVSANQFFAMSPSERELVTEIDLTLDDDCGKWYSQQGHSMLVVPHPKDDIEPGTDWIKP